MITVAAFTADYHIVNPDLTANCDPAHLDIHRRGYACARY
jgi:hypothetical protein